MDRNPLVSESASKWNFRTDNALSFDLSPFRAWNCLSFVIFVCICSYSYYFSFLISVPHIQANQQCTKSSLLLFWTPNWHLVGKKSSAFGRNGTNVVTCYSGHTFWWISSSVHPFSAPWLASRILSTVAIIIWSFSFCPRSDWDTSGTSI